LLVLCSSYWILLLNIVEKVRITGEIIGVYVDHARQMKRINMNIHLGSVDGEELNQSYGPRNGRSH
jgi:hypothetical protein